VGQFDVPNDAMAELNQLDDALTGPVERHDEAALHAGLEKVLEAVKRLGTPMPEDFIGPSDLMLPGPDSTVEEIRELLSEEGLIPD
jgi:hypothetical protein